MDWFRIPEGTSRAEFLCWEEALLDAVDSGELSEGATVWSAPEPMVVLGCGQKAAVEARIDRCGELGIPVLRRCSGGGTVLLGPGCLAYALFLRIPESGPLATIPGTNRWIMESQARWIAASTGLPVEVLGHSDLVVDGKKFSGNAQRRKRSALLFHGTWLYGFDLSRIADCLARPSAEPAYRAGREHLDFVRNLPASEAQLTQGFRQAWKVGDRSPSLPLERFQDLWRNRYSLASWHQRL